MKKLFGNMAYSLVGNTLNLLISSAISIIIPSFLGDDVEQYGYYQIYLFYVSYAGLFHLGLCDGILLKEGGNYYSNLNKRSYSFQLRALIVFEFFVSIIITFCIKAYTKNSNFSFISLAFCINLIIYLPRTLLSFILQATNKIKENAMITIIGRLSCLLAVFFLCLFHIYSYKYFIFADLLGKTIALFYVTYICRDILLIKPCSWKDGTTELKDNIYSGSKLMLASISSMVITGIVRFAIQQRWDVTTYGKISFTFSITNLVMSFISAIAIVLYPTLRRVNEKTSLSLYYKIRSLLMVVLLFSLISCYPLQKVLIRIFPQYTDSLIYLPILFPVCVYSAKVALLVQTYMQVFRKESQILKINLIGIAITVFNTLFSVIIFKNLTLSIFSILLSQAFRSIYAEFLLSKTINIKITRDCILENVLIVIFVMCSYFIGMMAGMVIYIFFYLFYVLIKYRSILSCIKTLFSLDISNN